MRRAAACIAVLLCAALAAGIAAGQAPEAKGAIDLTVTSVGFAPLQSVPSWTDGVGSQATLRIVVFNNHTAPAAYRVSYAWRDGDGEMPLNGADENSFDVSESPLSPRRSREHDFVWRLQPGQDGVGAIVATVRPTADETADGAVERNPADNVLAREVFVRTRSVTLTADPAPAAIEAEARGFVRVNLRNDGNSVERVALEILSAPTDSRLSAEFERPVVEVPAQATLNASLLVRYAPDGDFSAFSHRYVVRADPGFGADRTVETAPVAPAASGPLGNYAFSVVRVGGGTLSPAPGGEATATFRITNAGQRDDVYRAHGSVPAGWSAAAEPAQVALRPGESALVDLAIRPPPTALQGSVATARFAVTGSLRPDAQAVDVGLRTAGPSPRILSLGTTATVFVGAPAHAAVELENPGDAIQHASILTLAVRSPGSPDATSSTIVPPMGQGERATLTVPLAPPVTGGPLVLRATWANAAANAPTQTHEALVHDVVLLVLAPPASAGSPGEAVAYRNHTHAFTVRNEGNAAEDVRLAVESEAGDAAIEGDTIVVLEPGQSWRVAVRQDLPNPAGRTHLNLTLTALAGPRMASNSTATRVLDLDAPFLHASALPARWNMGPAHALPLALRIQDASAIAAANATVSAPSGQRQVVPLTLGADGVHRGTATLLEQGNHTVRFAARDVAGNSARSGAFVVTAMQLPPPVIRLEGVPPGGNLTDRVLRLRVDSELPVATLQVEVTQANATERHDVPVVDGNASLDLSRLEAGPVRLAVTAADASGATGRLEAAVYLPSAPATEGSSPAPQAPSAGPALLLVIFLAVCAACRRDRP